MASIPEFFGGSTIFVTGGTGFMGKVLIEKLLRSCPGIEKIYIIIRGKRGKTMADRLEELKSLPLFDKLKLECPEVLDKKLIGLEGDMMQPKLGLTNDDYNTLSETVNIIFHVAASVRFNDPLRQAVIMNTTATKEVVDLAYTMPKLAVLLHVSTTYCNCDRKEVKETVYPGHADWRQTTLIANNTDEALLNILTQKYMGNMPNTYTFTKSLAEQVIWEQKDKLPVVIFRPSIVISTWKEPFPGWIDNLNGPMGILIGYGKGVIRTTISDTSVVPDYMAVDLAIKAIIIAAWHRAMDSNSDKSMHVYNGSSVDVSISTQKMIKIAVEAIEEFPMFETVWKYATHTTNSRFWFTIHTWFKHVIPAIIIDSLLKLSGNKPRLLDVQIKYYVAMMALSFFTTNSWTFHNDHFLNLNKLLLPQDKESFDFDFRDIDPAEYFKSATVGAKKYLMKEPEELLPAAKLKAKKLYWLDMIVRGIFYIMTILLLFKYGIHRKVLDKINDYTSIKEL